MIFRPSEYSSFVQAGLLTSGSTYLPRLPANSAVAKSGVHPQLQRRARPRITRGSLLCFIFKHLNDFHRHKKTKFKCQGLINAFVDNANNNKRPFFSGSRKAIRKKLNVSFCVHFSLVKFMEYIGEGFVVWVMIEFTSLH